MGVYFLFFVLLFIFSIYDIQKRGSVGNGLFYVLYAFFSFLLIFKYGQGTDYFGYESIYDYVDKDNYLLYRDIGFSYCIILAKSLGVDYVYFNVFFNSIIAALYFIFIRRNCRYRVFALFALYCVFYFPIISSAIRQSLTIGIFAAFMLPQLREDKVHISYYLLCVLCCLFHIASIITIFLPLIRKVDVYKHAITILVATALFAVASNDIINAVTAVYERGSGYLDEESGSSALALLARLLMLIPILFVYKGRYAKQSKDFQTCILYFLVYLSTWSIPFISGRLLLYFRLFYIPGWEGVLQNKTLINKRALIAFIFLTLVIMYFKEINTAIFQGGYVNCNIFSYPFISIFNSEEIYFYRREF